MEEMTYAQMISGAIASEMNKNDSIIVMGQAVTAGANYSQTAGLLEKFGKNKIIDTGVSDSFSIEAALGSAMLGLKPIVFIDGTNLLKCADAIANQLCMAQFSANSQFRSSVVICADVGAVKGSAPQLNVLCEAAFTRIPELAVVYPSDASEAYSLLKEAINYDKPVLFLMDRKALASSDKYEKSDEAAAIGKAYVVKDGSMATIISYGAMFSQAQQAVNYAAKADMDCELISLRTLSPLDLSAIVRSVKKTGKLIIAHEGFKTGGLGAEIAAHVAESGAFDYLEAPIIRVAALDIPVGYNEKMYENSIPDWKDIYEAILHIA